MRFTPHTTTTHVVSEGLCGCCVSKPFVRMPGLYPNGGGGGFGGGIERDWLLPAKALLSCP